MHDIGEHMKFLDLKFGKPLPDGEYKVFPKEKDYLLSVMNGHSHAWYSDKVVSDGKIAKFYSGENFIWSCNAEYAAFNFKFVRLKK